MKIVNSPFFSVLFAAAGGSRIARLRLPGIARPIASALALAATLGPVGAAEEPLAAGSNPIIRDVFTADPAPLVVGDTVYLYAGRDNAKGKEMFTMPEWLCFSS